jgi:iron complex outermembrane receptor protein
MKKHRPAWLAASASGALLALGGAASAQETEGGLGEEIIVTARKVEEAQQTTPLAITTLTEAVIDRTFASDIRDLAGLSPNVHIEETAGFGTSSAFGIRGIHVSDPESTIDPAIGLVVQGVYFGRTAGGVIDMFDVRQIEVLRGPQGTLFGKNTTGGAINVAYRRPSDEFGVEGQLRYGNFDRADVRLAVEGPLVANVLNARLSLFRNVGEGFATDRITGQDRGGPDASGGRLLLDWTPAENINNLLTIEVIRDRTGASASQIVSDPSEGWGFCVFFGACDDGEIDVGSYSLPDRGRVDSAFVANTLEFELDSATLTSVTGYRSVDDLVNAEFDGGFVYSFLPNGDPANLFDGIRDQEYEQWSQELRVAGELDRLDYVLGVYYFWSEYALAQRLDLPFNDFSLGPPQIPFVGSVNTTGHQVTSSYAAFGEVNYDISDTLRVTAGLRYTYEEKQFDGILFGTALGLVPPVDVEADFSDVSPRLGIDWRASEDLFFYGSWARGFKSGGFSGRAFSAAQVGPYDDETVDAFELGFKSESFENRLRVNGAVFYNKYRDAQLEVNQPPAAPGAPASDEFLNAAQVVTSGFELEVEAAPVQGLILSANVGYLDARYDEFCAPIPRRSEALGGPGVGVPCGPTVNGVTPTDNTDLMFRRSPEWTARVGASYEVPVGAIGSLTFNADYTYTTEMALTLTNADFAIRPDAGISNASIVFDSADEHYRLSLFGRNLGDERFIQTASELGGASAVAWYNEPMTYGVELRFRSNP